MELRDSVTSIELQDLLATLRIGRYKDQSHPSKNLNNLINDFDESSSQENSPDNKIYQAIVAVDNKYGPAIKSLEGTSTSSRFISTPQNISYEVVDLASTSEDVEEDWQPTTVHLPSTSKKRVNLIASSSEDEDEYQHRETYESEDEYINDDYSSESREHDENIIQQPSTSSVLPFFSMLSLSTHNANLIPSYSSKRDHYRIDPSCSIKNIPNEQPRPLNYSETYSDGKGNQSTLPSILVHSTRTTTTAALSSLSRNFNAIKTQLAHDYYRKYNTLIFGNGLPAEMDISWNKRLTTTAGLTHYSRKAAMIMPLDACTTETVNPKDTTRTTRMVYSARIELSSKVIDTEEKLERTMVHEMCHCAAWLIDHVAKPPHGPVFKKYADKAMRQVPHMEVSTCHQYEIFYAYQWQCTGCNQTYGRHSKSIDCSKKVCGRCRGRLEFLGKFSKDGSIAKTRQPSAYNLYIKEHFAEAMKKPGAVKSEVMKELSHQYKKMMMMEQQQEEQLRWRKEKENHNLTGDYAAQLFVDLTL